MKHPVCFSYRIDYLHCHFCP